MRPVSTLEIGQAFWLAFERVDLSDAPGFLPGFPTGCCSWATWMIGHYLKTECGQSPLEIQGIRDGFDGADTHAWLSVNDMIVDITCGQYKDCPHPTIISVYSEWHSQWQVVKTAEIIPIFRYDSIPFPGQVLASEIYKRLELNVLSQFA